MVAVLPPPSCVSSATAFVRVQWKGMFVRVQWKGMPIGELTPILDTDRGSWTRTIAVRAQLRCDCRDFSSSRESRWRAVTLPRRSATPGSPCSCHRTPPPPSHHASPGCAAAIGNLTGTALHSPDEPRAVAWLLTTSDGAERGVNSRPRPASVRAKRGSADGGSSFGKATDEKTQSDRRHLGWIRNCARGGGDIGHRVGLSARCRLLRIQFGYAGRTPGLDRILGRRGCRRTDPSLSRSDWSAG